MSLINEYIGKLNSGWSSLDLESELQRLIIEYNSKKNTYLLVFSSAISKQIPQVSLGQDDYFTISDLLSSRKCKGNIDIYLETPGGSGEAAEEIVRFLHNNFDKVSFVIAGEAKSAGTIIALSGNEILMTSNGSLGPIDAQMKIGRSVISAHDYVEWVREKQSEAQRNGFLNPFDAQMIAQISPGEFGSVFHALKFAEDLVEEWLCKYKFEHWTQTETNKKPVTDEMKTTRAKEIAHELTNHSKWRSHGRSIKIADLERIGLKTINIDNDPQISDIVNRIQVVIKLLFESTTTFKIFVSQDFKIFRQAVPNSVPVQIPNQNPVPDVVNIDQKCPKCGNITKMYAKFIDNPRIDSDFKAQGFIPMPENMKLKCSCGFEIDLTPIKNQIESGTGRKILFKDKAKL